MFRNSHSCGCATLITGCKDQQEQRRTVASQNGWFRDGSKNGFESLDKVLFYGVEIRRFLNKFQASY